MIEDYQGSESEEIRELLKEFGRELKEKVPEGWGFTFMLFNYGEGGNMLYISSAERKTMCQAMREFLGRQEQ